MVLRIPQVFFFLKVSRPDSGNCHERHAHFFSLRAPDVITHLAQGLDVLFVCLKSHVLIGHVFVECSFDPVSSNFLITCFLTDTTYCFTDATDWNQIKPLCNSALEWTVWPSGRSDLKHQQGIERNGVLLSARTDA